MFTTGKLFSASDLFRPCMDPAVTALHPFQMAKKKSTPPAARPTWKRLPLKEWLEFFDRSQAWLSQATGYSDPFVSLVLAGKRPYNQEFVEAVAKALSKVAGEEIDPSMLFHPPRSQNQW